MAKNKNDYIERTANENYMFVVCASDMRIICDEKTIKPNKKNTKTIIPGSVSRKVDNAFSNEITERSCNTRI